MSMNRFVGLGIFALSSSVLLTMAACDDSATAPGIVGTGGNPSATTKNSEHQTTTKDTDSDTETEATTTKATTKATTKTTGAGGSSSKSSTTKKTSAAGGSKDTADTSESEGGAGSDTTKAGTDTATPVDCTPGETDLMPIAAATDTGNWIGGIDSATEDNPCGVQGAFYAYSDTGADGANGGSDDSLQSPKWLEGTTYDNPCADGKCCIKGSTVLWPKAESGGSVDYTLNWGAGLGLSLGDGGESNPGKSAYAGTAKGFRIKLSGSLGGGQTVRIMYTQSETDTSAPFTPTTKLGEADYLFEDAACPSWATDCTDTGYGGPTPYDLQVQVAGGDDAGDFEVCIDSLIPIDG